MMKPVTIVVPCFNEAGRLQPEEFLRFVGEHPDIGFLFVDDGSTDDTASILSDAARANPAVEVLSLERNSGKAEAVRRGVLSAVEAGSRYVGYWDADLSTPLSAIATFRKVLDEDPVVVAVLGSRVRLLGRSIQRKTSRHYTGRVFAAAASIVLGLPVYDTQCGAKLFRVEAGVEKVFATPFVSRWIFDVEILARLTMHEGGFGSDPAAARIVVEVPLLQWTDIPGSRLKASDYGRAAIELFRIWRRHASGLRSVRATATEAGPRL